MAKKTVTIEVPVEDLIQLKEVCHDAILNANKKLKHYSVKANCMMSQDKLLAHFNGLRDTARKWQQHLREWTKEHT